jgi:formiminoglutamase
MTLSGFSVEELRQFISFFGKIKMYLTIHICEGAPDLGEENTHLIGKLIGYLVTDFINQQSQHLIDRIRPSNESQFMNKSNK